MTITTIKPLLADAVGAASTSRTASATEAFAAVARQVAAGELAAARAAVAAIAPGAASADAAGTLGQMLAEGNLAAARLALAGLGAEAMVAPAVGKSAGSGVAATTGAASPETAVKSASSGVSAAAGAAPPAGKTNTATLAHRTAQISADVAPAPTQPEQPRAVRLPPLQGQDLQDMLKLQTGSFNPALYQRLGSSYNDYVNAYGAGGYYYDPAAIALAGMSAAQLAHLQAQYASPQQWLAAQGGYAGAVAAMPATWTDVQRMG